MAINTVLLDLSVDPQKVAEKCALQSTIQKVLSNFIPELKEEYSICFEGKGFLTVFTAVRGTFVTVRGFPEGLVSIDIEYYLQEEDHPLLPFEGGLLEPSEEWSRISKVCELEFKVFHGEKFIKKDKQVVKLLAAKVFERFDSIPLEVISSYIKMRTIIRMKDLNLSLSDSKMNKKQGSTDASRKRLAKVKKIAT